MSEIAPYVESTLPIFGASYRYRPLVAVLKLVVLHRRVKYVHVVDY